MNRKDGVVQTFLKKFSNLLGGRNSALQHQYEISKSIFQNKPTCIECLSYLYPFIKRFDPINNNKMEIPIPYHINVSFDENNVPTKTFTACFSHKVIRRVLRHFRLEPNFKKSTGGIIIIREYQGPPRKGRH